MFRTLSAAALIVAAASPLAAQAGGQTIARAQWLAQAETEFGQVDTNKDGKMSRTEIETFQRAAAARMIAERNKQIFAALDADKNGQISAAEFAKLSNPNPKVDISNVMSVDSNKDGQVSLAEHKAATLQTFTAGDTNKDGTLTTAELEALSRK